MEKFTSILLRYKAKNHLLYLILSEFLKLTGIYVCEEVLDEATEKTMIFLSNMHNKKNAQSDFSIEYIIKERNNNDVHAILTEFISKIKEHSSKNIDFAEWLDSCKYILEVFLSNNLWQASLTLYNFKMGVNLVEKAGEQFENAADTFVEICKDANYSNRHICYAKTYCMQKANLARDYCEKSLAYYVNSLGNEVLELIKIFPDFSNAWVLLGLINDIAKEYAIEEINAFQRNLIMLNNKLYASETYYLYGKVCERYDSHRNTSEKAFLASYNVYPSYRNAYKVAYNYMEKKDWKNALLYFDKALKLLEKFQEYKQPLEQEYYFRINIHKGYIYSKQRSYDKVINCVQKSLKLRKHIENDDDNYVRLWKQMYGVHYEKCKSMELERMNTKQANLYMATALQNIGMVDEAKKYWEKVQL